MDPGEGVPEALQQRRGGEICRGSIPSYPSPERAVIALARAVRYAEWRERPAGTVPELADIDAGRAERVVRAVLAEAPRGRELSGGEARELLAAYGIEVLAATHAADRQGAIDAAERLGHPVVLKSTERRLRHRADLGGVRLDLGDATAVGRAWDGMPRDDGVLVQAMAAPGVATTVNVVDDPSFGALVGFGVAGVATELLGDRAYRATPLSDADAADLVRSVRAWPLLAGYRGADPADVAALEELLLRVGRLADDLPEVLRLELEPVVVSAEGVTVAGAEIVVGPATSRASIGPRLLGSPQKM